MRLPKNDPADYGWGPGNGRPVYFCSGEPQPRGIKTGRMNETTGIASTTGKFASAFAFGAQVLRPWYPELAERIDAKAEAAYQAGLDKPGICQTASIVSPYIYEECNWTDDMELAAVELYRRSGSRRFLKAARSFGRQEPVTPWMGADTARHYQWYPFMNMGHVRVAQASRGPARRQFIRYLRRGIKGVWKKAQGDPFLNGIPGIWCSNNLTAAMLTQCILYREITGDRRFEEMEGALRDWLLGCNPWGVSMIVELPLGGVYPTEPHSFMINEKVGNTTGGLVDGPVYETIFGSLSGVHLDGGNDYALFQPGRKVYHDCTHDYSTNEPTMDGTASLTFPLSYYESLSRRSSADRNVYRDGCIVRTDPSQKRISLVFTAADKADGADTIIRTLGERGVKGAFFFTGEFYELFPDVIRRLVDEGHYVGSHSYGHLLYCDWDRRDSTFVSREEFRDDLVRSYAVMAEAGVPGHPRFFIPPYEHYNALTASWAREMGLQMVNLTGGTLTNGDYTTPSMKRYYSSDMIMQRVFEVEKREGLNGHILLVHLGTEAERTDKFYNRLGEMMDGLTALGYSFVPLAEAIMQDFQ
jgi:peptidoglycan/xylan/chitin deacetylase (PgdA/CDA1 family)